MCVFSLKEFHRDSISANEISRQMLPVQVSMRYIRFHPTQQRNWNCLRVEVYGIGVPSKLLSLFTASSINVVGEKLQAYVTEWHCR